MTPKTTKLTILIRRGDIHKRVRAVARQITRDFNGQRVHLVGVLKGASYFSFRSRSRDRSRNLDRLHRRLELRHRQGILGPGSHGEGLDTRIAGLNVILVEDILDTGLTLSYLLRVLRQRRPKPCVVAVMLDKPRAV